MKKLPPRDPRKEIFSESSGQLVQLQGHAALLAGSSILVQNTLGHSLVDSLDSSLVGSSGSSLILAENSLKEASVSAMSEHP